MTTETVRVTREAAQPGRRRVLVTAAAVAGVGYTLLWVAGLSVSSSSTDVNSTGAQVVAGYAGHQAAATAQFLLTEGAASVALAVVAIALARAGRRAAAGGPGGMAALLTGGAGIVAGVIALVQCALGVYLTTSVVPDGRAGAAATISDVVNRLDGVKMLVLAAMAVAGTVAARRTGILPGWLVWTGVALAVAITVSGVGYALLNSGLALVAWVSLPLLLLWVTGSGIAAGRKDQVACRARA